MTPREFNALGLVKRPDGSYGKPTAAEAARAKPTRRDTQTIIGEHARANKTEAAYERHLAMLKLAGEIADYRFHTLIVWLAPGLRYETDFVVAMPDGRTEVHEVKGFERDDAAAKFKMAAASLPWMTFRMIHRKGGKWIERRRILAA